MEQLQKNKPVKPKRK